MVSKLERNTQRGLFRLKNGIKSLGFIAGIDLNKNMRYDRLSNQIMSKALESDSNCIDIGSHQGEMLDQMIRHSPNGTHMAFEPIPGLFERLRVKYANNPRVRIFPHALSDRSGRQEFQLVSNDPAYSGFKRRDYKIRKPQIETIEVSTRKLDEVLLGDECIHFMKIDVEGAELLVLRGARETLMRCKPLVIFEFGLGASNYYNSQPQDIFGEFQLAGMQISTLEAFLHDKEPLKLEELNQLYSGQKEYYFIGHPNVV